MKDQLAACRCGVYGFRQREQSYPSSMQGLETVSMSCLRECASRSSFQITSVSPGRM